MLDNELTFDEATAHLTTEASTNLIDLNSVGNIGAGTPVYVTARVTAAMTDTGSDSTQTLTVETDDNTSFSSPTTIQTLGTFAATAAVGTKLSMALALSDSYKRYIRIKYTVAGGNLTTGSFSVYLSLVPDADYKYPDALTE
tara:strand:+ start:719 stop:1144 length:426 start_codon:yes stop_codon:yes gene_type:complete